MKIKLVSVFCAVLFLMAGVNMVSARADIFDRVVGFVDNAAITLSELDEQYEKTVKVSPDITREEVLNTMINRILLLREARKYRIEGLSADDMVKEYINLKVRAFIRVTDAETEEFYKKNTARFGSRDYEDVRAEIENYLTEKTLNERLKEMLRDLRKGAYIKIQLK